MYHGRTAWQERYCADGSIGGGSVWQLLAYISTDQETKDRKQGQAIKPDLFPLLGFTF